MDERVADGQSYDVVVIGGGAAGLSGALTLGRARRSVLVVDSGQPRNAPADGVHTYLGREGVAPAELLADGRAEVRGYGGAFTDGTVVAAERTDDGFRVALADGRTVGAARLLVTTGLVDELPEVPGVAELWGTDVPHCPYCHGWEVRDQAIGVLATGPLSVGQALLWRQWSADLTYFLHTAPEPGESAYEQLAARGITVVRGEVAGLETSGGRLSGVRLADGRIVPRRVLVVAPRLTARAGFLASLGLAPADVEMGGHVIGSHVPADPAGATEVPGVWVAGNVTALNEQVIGAAAAGVRAAAAVNADLIAEDVRRAVASGRAASGRPSTERASDGRASAERHAGHGAHGGQGAQGSHAGHPGASASDAAAASAEEFWDDFYRAKEQVWSGRPNAALVRETAELPPGRALDLGCGEGADAIWLAERGWRVTGTDVSGVALGRAAAHASAADVGDRIDWQRHDLSVSFPTGDYDLVSAHFFHSPVDLPRDAVLRKAAAAVAPGGVLLVVGHAGFPSWEENPDPAVRFPTTDEVLTALELPDGEWDLLLTDVHEQDRVGPDGQPATHRNNTVKLRRRAAATADREGA